MTYKHSIDSLDDTFWTQATWFIDPQNVTGLANDNNSGIDATHPVLTYNGGIVTKWGTKSPTLAQDTTITWLSDANRGTGDSVILTPVMAGAVLTLQGIVNASRIVHSGVLASVVPKVIAASPGEALLQADIGYVEADPNFTIIRNTTVGKVSNAWLDLPLMGTNWSLSQPLIDGAAPFIGANPAAEINTWANGDTFEAIHYCNVNIVVLQPTISEYASPTFPAQIQVRTLNVIGAGGFENDDVYVGDDVTFVQCATDASLVTRANEDAEATFYYNCNALVGIFDASGSNYFTTWQGGRLISYFGSVVSFALSHDVIVDSNATGIPSADNLVWGQTFRPQNPFFTPMGGSVYLRHLITGFGMVHFDSTISSDGQARVWGPGTLDTQGFTRISYVQSAVSTFLCAALKANGLTTAYAIATTDPAVWHPGRTISAANLDATVAGGGFGGVAVNPGGSSYINGPN